MILKFYLKALFVCLLINLSKAHEGHDHSQNSNSDSSVEEEWGKAHKVSLKSCQGVDFKWLSKNETYVTMEMSSFTKGYVSVGFCPTWKGTMEGCDIVIGWVSNQNGTAYLFDYYARGNTLPELDESQDYELLEGKQELGYTTIKFQRKWDTSDFYDANLGEKVRVIWAWHPEDPFSRDSYFKHAGNSRGHMMEDISLRKPASNEYYHHEELHSEEVNSVGYLSLKSSLLFACLSIIFAF